MGFCTSSNLCERSQHENLVDDYREGNVVCIDCGLVLEPIYEHPKINNNKNIVYNQNNKEQPIITTLLEVPKLHNNLEKETAELDILCHKLQLYSVTKTQVFEKWELIKEWFFNQKLKDRKNQNFNKGLIVMAIYETLIELDIPRPISHLCQDAGILPKYVWYWIKLYHKNKNREHKKTILKPTSMSEYFLKPLNLTYKEIKEINQLVMDNDILTYAPKTILASCAYMFLKKTKKQNFSVKKLANLLGVSVMSVYRCVAALKK